MKKPLSAPRLPVVIALFVALIGGGGYAMYRSIAAPKTAAPTQVAKNWLNSTSGNVAAPYAPGASRAYGPNYGAFMAHKPTKHPLAHAAHKPHGKHKGKAIGKHKHKHGGKKHHLAKHKKKKGHRKPTMQTAARGHAA